MSEITIAERREEEFHAAFDITLFLKGAHAIIEIVGGAVLYFVSAESIVRLMNYIVRGEIGEDPHDIIANYLLHLAHAFGGSSQAFAAVYLFIHGIINGAVVVALWREKLWAYPAALTVLVAFIGYQCYLFIFGFSLWLFLFTVLDIVIIFLVWHEYGVLKKRHAKKNAARKH